MWQVEVCVRTAACLRILFTLYAWQMHEDWSILTQDSSRRRGSSGIWTVHFVMYTSIGLSIELTSYLDTEHTRWQGPLWRSHRPWTDSGLARNVTPFKLCVPYDPLRVRIPMSLVPLKVALLDEDVSAGTDCPPAIICSIACTFRTTQI